MPSPGRGFLRDNAFLIAATILPAAVAGFFILATTIPRWTVPPPAYDLVLTASRPYTATPSAVVVEFGVSNGQVTATVRPAPPGSHVLPSALFVFEHATMTARGIPVDLPASMGPEEPARTLVVAALAGRRVANDRTAPDGYEVRTAADRGAGLVGEIFGMSRYRQRMSLEKDGRVVPVELPPPFGEPWYMPALPLGWIVGEAGG